MPLRRHIPSSSEVARTRPWPFLLGAHDLLLSAGIRTNEHSEYAAAAASVRQVPRTHNNPLNWREFQIDPLL